MLLLPSTKLKFYAHTDDVHYAARSLLAISFTPWAYLSNATKNTLGIKKYKANQKQQLSNYTCDKKSHI